MTSNFSQLESQVRSVVENTIEVGAGRQARESEVGELLRVLERFGQIGLLWLGPWNVIHAWNLRNLATVYRYGGDVHFAAFQLGRQLPFILCRLTIAGKPR